MTSIEIGIFRSLLKSCFNMRYLTVIIITFFYIKSLTYGDIWLFELKNAHYFVLSSKKFKSYCPVAII